MLRLSKAQFEQIFGKKAPKEPKPPKYRNRKCSWRGIDFPSERERDRYIQLWHDQKDGKISGLQTQVKFVLIPPQKIDGKLVERGCSYVADFVYKDPEGRIIVEDTKGFRTREYVIKRKLMLEKYGVWIREI